MKYGYARVSTDGQSLDAQVKQLRTAGAEKVGDDDFEVWQYFAEAF
jgi:DNA invertase Pin-like site-specific DNA recombinase